MAAYRHIQQDKVAHQFKRWNKQDEIPMKCKFQTKRRRRNFIGKKVFRLPIELQHTFLAQDTDTMAGIFCSHSQ